MTELECILHIVLTSSVFPIRSLWDSFSSSSPERKWLVGRSPQTWLMSWGKMHAGYTKWSSYHCVTIIITIVLCGPTSKAGYSLPKIGVSWPINQPALGIRLQPYIGQLRDIISQCFFYNISNIILYIPPEIDGIVLSEGSDGSTLSSSPTSSTCSLV